MNLSERMEKQTQMMIDSVIAVQDIFPMAEDGITQWIKDIEYTNDKHGWNLLHGFEEKQ